VCGLSVFKMEGILMTSRTDPNEEEKLKCEEMIN
jgi:hypothetical protein